MKFIGKIYKKSSFLTILVSIGSFASLLFSVKPTLGQTYTIRGKVTDSVQKPIEQALVALKEIDKSNILAFTYTDQKGQFLFDFKTARTKSLTLEVRHSSYQTKKIIMNEGSSNHHIVLDYVSNLLEEVNISKPMVYKNKDTLNYQVSAFQTDQDRVIADILRRLPGIEIVDGEIHYQGKSIQKFMINHLDLMQGQYGIIHQNMPSSVVTEIQIIENHQPIRILDSIVHSDRASINLVVKKLSTTGTIQLGAGANPNNPVWDINFTPILLAKRFQMLTSLQSNQAGRNPIDDLKDHFDTRKIVVMHAGGIQKQDPTFLQLVKSPTPSLPKNTWLDNQSHLGSIHLLTKIKKETELRTQITYSQHLDRQHSFVYQDFQMAGINSKLQETLKNNFLEKSLETSLGIESNQRNFYLINLLRFRASKSSDTGISLLSGTPPINQHVNLNTRTWLNDFNSILKVGKQRVQITSEIEWKEAPQVLKSTPVTLQNMVYEFEFFDQIQQALQLNSFSATNKISILKQFRDVKINLPLFLNTVNQYLDSDVTLKNLENEFELSSKFKNKNKILTHEFKIAPNLQYNIGATTIILDLPLSRLWRQVHTIASLDSNWARTVVNPTAHILYKFNSNHELSFQSAYQEDHGIHNLVYPGYILVDFRTIRQMSDAKMFNRQWINSTNYKFEKIKRHSIIMGNASYKHSSGSQNYILANKIDSIGHIVSETREQPAESQTHFATTYLSHYIRKIRMGYAIRLMNSSSKVKYILNENSLNRKLNLKTIELNAYNQQFKRLSIFYKLKFSQATSSYKNGDFSVLKTNSWLHSLEFQSQIYGSHDLIIKSSAFNNTNMSDTNWFLDITYRYRIVPLKMDLNLSCINLFNENQYIYQRYTDFGLMETRYQMRPIHVLASLQWQFGNE